jgi:hypothetical protein
MDNTCGVTGTRGLVIIVNASEQGYTGKETPLFTDDGTPGDQPGELEQVL